jgi:fucose 4-O-acetylase-like acetyltransferase
VRVSVPQGSPTAASSTTGIDLSKRDLTLDLARVFCVLLVVVIHLLETGVGTGPNGLVVSRPLEHQAWFDGATWVFQIMPLFFVVGGFASLTSWRSLQRRGGTGADYVTTRVIRLAQPALPLFIFYVVVVGGATLIGVDPELLHTVVLGAGSPLWFLAAYGLCQAVAPCAARWHAAAPKLTLLVLLAGAVVVDAARYRTGIIEIGLINLFFVWVLIQQFGFWYADGWFDRRPWWQLVLIGVGSWATLFPLTIWGPYGANMLSNLNPPTVPLIAIGLMQTCALRLFKPALGRIMQTRAARAVVFAVGTRLMTIYLWHLPLIITLAGVALLIPGASPEPATPAWWWSRIPVYLLVIALLFALSLLVGRFETARPLASTPPGWAVAFASALTIVPPLLIIEFFLDLKLAIMGAVFFTLALLLLRRSRTPPEKGIPASALG